MIIKVKKSYSEIKELFKNVYFIIGTAYAGKSTMIKYLSEKYDGIWLRENYIEDVMKTEYKIDTVNQPNLCYFDTMSSWDEFVNRTPEEYVNWMNGCSRESTPIEINEILKNVEKYPDRKIFVDTSIPIDVLKEISDKDHVLVMLCDREVSINRFFEREDKEKQFLYKVILESENKNAMENYRKILEKINSEEKYNEFLNSGFCVLMKDDNRTVEETSEIVSKIFKLKKEGGINMDLLERNKDNKEFFAEKADGYDEVHKPFMNTKAMLTESIDVDPKKVIDLGAGTGLELIEFFKKYPNARVKAIDLTIEMLNKIKEREFADKVDIVCDDFFACDFGKDNDVIMSTSALHHFLYDEKVKLYKKIYNALREGGLFINSDYTASNNEEEEQGIYNYIHKVNRHNDTPLTLEHELEILHSAGFNDIEVKQPELETYKLIKARK